MQCVLTFATTTILLLLLLLLRLLDLFDFGSSIFLWRNAAPFVDVPERPNAAGCLPKRKLIYIKTHKTGSSTLSTIFHR